MAVRRPQRRDQRRLVVVGTIGVLGLLLVRTAYKAAHDTAGPDLVRTTAGCDCRGVTTGMSKKLVAARNPAAATAASRRRLVASCCLPY